MLIQAPISTFAVDDPFPGLKSEVALERLCSATDFPASAQTLVPSGAKARANIAAIELLGRLRAVRRPTTPAEQRVLAAWSG